MSVTNVQATDFTLAGYPLAGGGATGTIASVSGSGAAYTVTVNNVSGNGTLGLNLVDNDSIVDQAGNPLGGPGAGNGNFTGQVYTIDNTAPTIAIGSPSVAYAAGGPVTYTVTYADAKFNTSTLAAANITLNATGTASGTIGVSGSGLTRTVTISSITGNGTLGISIAAGTASDLAGKLAPAAGPSTTFTVDNTAPTISISAPSVAYLAGGPVSYTVTYTDANFNASTLGAANITQNKTGTARGILASQRHGPDPHGHLHRYYGQRHAGDFDRRRHGLGSGWQPGPGRRTQPTFTVDNIAPTISIGSPSQPMRPTGPSPTR